MNKRIRLFEEIITAVLLLVTLFPLVHYGELAGIPVPRHFFHGEILGLGTKAKGLTFQTVNEHLLL